MKKFIAGVIVGLMILAGTAYAAGGLEIIQNHFQGSISIYKRIKIARMPSKACLWGWMSPLNNT